MSSAKRVIAEGLDNALRDANDLEREGFERLFESQDSREGMSAFLEKRAANFRGV